MKIFRRTQTKSTFGSLFATNDEELIRLYRDYCSWPEIYYANTTLIAQLSGAKSILEIGVAYGYHALSLLRNTDATYVGIDPYRAGYDLNDAFEMNVQSLFNADPQTSFDRLHLAVLNTLNREYPGRSELIRKTSIEGMEYFEDEEFDLIFLDGDHTYANLIKELPIAWRKLKMGGVLMGDDFEWRDVRLAVMEYCERNMLDLHYISKEYKGYATWIVRKG